ncbi:MAG: T9SS C-terminal target domain-containing protein [Ignavibacteriales bacterium]|nr:MAG: T9SS C-terminal target domain-containing protein [Ignavibacteriales bacterium]
MKKFNFIILCLLLICVVRAQTDSIVFTSSNLPIFVIDTHGQVIVNEPKIEVDLGIIYNGEGVRNNITDPFNHYDGRIGIEIRGSSSQMFPKKQYGFETIDSSGEEIDISLLGFPEESDWILFAPYNDKSLIRDAIAYKLSNNIGRYASRSKFCELVLNGEYMGVFVLFEKIKRDKNRVDVTKLTETDTTGDALTGGYIFKIDKDEGGINDGWLSIYPPYLNGWQRIYYMYHFPKPEDIVEPQKNYIQSFVDSFETKMHNPDFANTLTGYVNFIDINSFVDYFILNELNKNVDAYRLSAFLYKDRDSKERKLKAGPIWDFNHAFGNCDYYNASFVEGWQLDYATYNTTFLHSDNWQVPFWWKKLFSDINFKKKIALRWQELRTNEFSNANIFSIIDSLTTLLDESRVRNFIKWPVLGVYVWPNAYIGQTYSDEINYLKNWITNHFNWIDEELGSFVGIDEPQNSLLNFSLSQNYPNPFNPTTTIKYSIPNVETGHAPSLQVTLKVYDVLGKEVATLVNEEKQPGIYEVEFNPVSGIRNLASGIYYYRLKASNFIQTKKMILLK